MTLEKILGYAGVTIDQVKAALAVDSTAFPVTPLVEQNIFIECQYAHYIKKQLEHADQLASTDWNLIDLSRLDYAKMRTMLGNEDFQRLDEFKPQNLSAA